MAYAFDYGWLSVAQGLAYKPLDGRLADRPWTRSNQYATYESAAIAGALNWENDPQPFLEPLATQPSAGERVV